MKYRSIERTGFEAYQLNFDKYDSNKTHRWFRELPEWLQAKNAKGEFDWTVNPKTQEARIKNDYGWQKVYPDMWIICNAEGHIFVMIDALFRESFENDT